MVKYDKPFKTYDELISLLESRNLTINDKGFAQIVLSTISYYDLVNGYKELFMVNDKFIDGISIEYLYSFFLFDTSFQNILIKYSFHIERIFKNNLAYVIAENYGEDHKQYLDQKNYQNSKKNKSETFRQTFANLNDICNPQNEYIDNPTRHYVASKNHIPPWILFKNATFSDCINLYSFLKSAEKDEICNMIIDIPIGDAGMKKDIFYKSLNIVRKFRNVIAHNLKFITFRCYEKNSLHLAALKPAFGNSLINRSDFRAKRGFNDIYSMILSIIILLKDESLIKSFLNELIDFLQKVSGDSSYTDMTPFIKRYLTITNMPLDLSSRLEVYRNHLIKK